MECPSPRGLLERNGKLTMWMSKSSRLSYSLVASTVYDECEIKVVSFLNSHTYLTGRLAWSRRNTVGVGPTPYKWFLPELDLHLSREWATLAAFSRISGVGHSGSWPPLHCGDSTNVAPEAVPGASLHSEALSPECGREHQGTGDGLANSTCRSRA